MQEIINTIKRRKNFYALMSVLLISFFAFQFIRKSFSLLNPVRSIEIFSNNVSYSNNDPGAWKVTKSASWTGVGKARITVDVDTILKTPDTNYKDIIMVLDISSSMEGDKLTRVKEDSIELINSILSNSNNKVALITFESTSTLVSGLTNDKNNLIGYINNLTDMGCTNYYRALQNVGSILENYTKQNNRECIVMFLTDGYPNADTPNQIGEYQFLKDTYPYVTFNGIQYEMGNTVLEPIKEISDNQWIADMSSLNNVLFEASVSPIIYEEFTFIDYIDTTFFNISSIDSIKTKIGNVTLDGNKITWTISNYLKSGSKASMTIDVTLKNEYLNTGGNYPTNSSEEVISKIEGNSNENVSSNLTPVLQDNYVVIYDGNAPSDCTVSNVPNSVSKKMFENVEISNNKPKCSGYQFKGWKLITEGVTKINDDYFIMPEKDVTIRAVWSKLALTKSVNGKIAKAGTLYDVLKEEATRSDIATSARLAVSYTGSHQDSMDASKSTETIYHWYGSIEANGTAIRDRFNVVFGDLCWQMIRTTDTGGVRLLYNGVPTITGSGYNISYDCSDNREGTISPIKSTLDLSGTKQYSSSYTYASGTYSLTNPTQIEVSSSNASSTISYIASNIPYTCNNSNTSCTSLYKIDSQESSTYAYVYTFDRDNIGYSKFNSSSNSTSDVGYMYNSRYEVNKTSLKTQTSLDSNATYLIGSSLEDNGDGTFSLIGNVHEANSSNWNSSVVNDYNNSRFICFPGHYTYDSNTGENTCYDNRTANNVVAIGYIIRPLFSDFLYNPIYKYGFGIQADSENYKLVSNNNEDGTLQYIYNWGSKSTSNCFTNAGDTISSCGYQTLSKSHYTCYNLSGTCSTYYYINYTDDYYTYSVALSNGKHVNTDLTDTNNILYEMLYKSDVNATNSIIKDNIDTWYQNTLLTNYDSYVDDTIYCNNRTIKNFGVWNPNGGTNHTNIIYYLQFNENGLNKSLDCPKVTDRFSISNSSARLKYKVGLMSSPEMNLLNQSNVSKNSSYYWLVSPRYFDDDFAAVRGVSSNGGLSYDYVNIAHGVRPAISLKPSMKYSKGDGSMTDPYVVDLNYIYTVNKSTSVNIGSTIPSSITTYISPIDAMNANDNKPFYLKHIIEDNIVKASYVEFVVTPEMASANPGMRSGTYSLRGAGATSNGNGGYNEDSPYYASNVNTLKQAFGENSGYCTAYASGVSCSVTGFRVDADSHGLVLAKSGTVICRGYEDGSSYCNE